MERSLVNEVFTMGYVQGVGVDWWIDKGSSNMWRLRASINDGVRSGEADGNHTAERHNEDTETPAVDKSFHQDNSDFAVTARLDLRLMGDWGQGDDFTAWEGENASLLVGAAVHWEMNETGDGDNGDDDNSNASFVTWTVDGSWEYNRWNLFAAVTGIHHDGDFRGPSSNTSPDPNHHGFVLQGGYQLVPDKFEPFIRWEVIDLSLPLTSSPDIEDDEDLHLFTFGFNWYFNKHAAKFTTDIVWATNALLSTRGDYGIDNESLSLLGLLTDSGNEEDQIVWRTQFQLLF